MIPWKIRGLKSDLFNEEKTNLRFLTANHRNYTTEEGYLKKYKKKKKKSLQCKARPQRNFQLHKRK